MLNIIKEHIYFRRQLLQLAKSDLIRGHRGAALGWLWDIIKPGTMIAVYWFVFTFGIRSSGGVDGSSFFIFLLIGITPWFFMSAAINGGANSIRKYRYLVTKMKFPVSTIPTFVLMSRFIVHFCMMALVIVILLVAGHKIPIQAVQLPLYMLLMFLFFNAWSIFSAMIVSFSTDFLNMIRSTVRVLFWISGILYSIDAVSVGWIKDVMRFNPITFFVQGYRNSLLYGKWFFEDWKVIVIFAIIFVGMWLAASLTYNRLRKQLVDVL